MISPASLSPPKAETSTRSQPLSAATRTWPSEIARLPERERVVVTLFYVADRAQSDIAAFLEVPTSTIKKRLFDARRRLKERMMSQLGDHLREQRPSQDERFMRRVQFLIAVRTGDLAVIQRQLEADPALVHVTLTGEEWGRAEMDQPTLPVGLVPESERTGLLGRVVDPSGNPLDGLGPVPAIVRPVTPPTGATVPEVSKRIGALDGGMARFSTPPLGYQARDMLERQQPDVVR
jgi:hypothetical protein